VFAVSPADQVDAVVISRKWSLDVLPTGQLAVEIGDCEAVLILEPKLARKLATTIRTRLGANEDLIAEHDRTRRALDYQRKKRRQQCAR
jgi:hypothetical protein